MNKVYKNCYIDIGFNSINSVKLITLDNIKYVAYVRSNHEALIERLGDVSYDQILMKYGIFK